MHSDSFWRITLASCPNSNQKHQLWPDFGLSTPFPSSIWTFSTPMMDNSTWYWYWLYCLILQKWDGKSKCGDIRKRVAVPAVGSSECDVKDHPIKATLVWKIFCLRLRLHVIYQFKVQSTAEQLRAYSHSACFAPSLSYAGCMYRLSCYGRRRPWHYCVGLHSSIDSDAITCF